MISKISFNVAQVRAAGGMPRIKNAEKKRSVQQNFALMELRGNQKTIVCANAMEDKNTIQEKTSASRQRSAKNKKKSAS